MPTTNRNPNRDPSHDDRQRARRPTWLDQAHDEAGVTAISPRAAWLLVVSFVLLLLAGGFGQLSRPVIRGVFADLSHGVVGAIRDTPTTDGVNATLRRLLDETETRLETASVLGTRSRPWVQRGLLRIGRIGNEQVIVGRESVGAQRWLAYRPGVDYVTGRPFLDPDVLHRRTLGGTSWEPRPQPDPRPAIRDFAAQLGARGIDLLVVPTPTKVMLHPEAVGVDHQRARALSAEALHNASFETLIADLEDVEIFDPTAALAAARDVGDTRMFLRDDSHWSPIAVDVVAREMADRLRSLIPSVELQLDRPTERARWRRGHESRSAVGDLVPMLDLDDDDRPREQIVAQPVTRNADPDLRSSLAPTSLAPSSRAPTSLAPSSRVPDAPVVLIGDSFTGVYADDRLGWGQGAGLAAQLAFHLGTDVASRTVHDGGAEAVRRRFIDAFRRGDHRGVRVVVWQFAVRELSTGNWPSIPIVDPGPGPQTSTQMPPLRVAGTVVDRAVAPRPGSTPYPDALIAIHLADVVAIDPASPHAVPSSLVLFTWGLRDGQATQAARIAAGDRLEARLVPWDAVADMLGAIQRRELTDPALFSLDIFWLDTDDVDEADLTAPNPMSRKP